LSKATVMFSSNGGSLLAGIEIGRMMRLKGFQSLVPDGASCASACALAWLGAAKRLMGPTGQVGFHAVYILKDGAASPDPGANALMVAYLNEIGLPGRAVLYITSTAPQEMAWLKLEDAQRLGIDVSLYTPDMNTQPPNPSAAPLGEPPPPKVQTGKHLDLLDSQQGGIVQDRLRALGYIEESRTASGGPARE
jgi:hypothetical protein